MNPILIRGRIRTLDPTRPRAEALVVRGERIEYVGSLSEARGIAGSGAREVDFESLTVQPGFIDAHLHLFMFGGMLLRFADLTGSGSVGELQERLTGHGARYGGPWLQGRGWDQDLMGRHPTRNDLDAVAGERPCVVTRVCGHAVVANSAAIALLTDAERAAGDPETGLYTETAIAPFYRRVPPLDASEQEEAVLRAADVALKTGVTSVGTLLDTPDQLGAYHRLHRRGRLPIRVTGMPPWTSVEPLHAQGIGTGFGDDRLRIGGAKLFSDGSLGARTARLAVPYADGEPGNLGLRIYDPADLTAKAVEAHRKGFQIVIHAIGDQAVRESLDAIEAALGDEDNRWHRHRIEHVSILPPDLLERMARKRILAVVQPQFVVSDYWTPDRVGPERARWTYPFASMRRAGIPLALSSDCPVERLDAFACLAAAVGRAPWSPDEGLNVDDALDAYGPGAAYSLHAEDRVGALKPGLFADFVVLETDLTTLSADQIRTQSVSEVWIGGQRVMG